MDIIQTLCGNCAQSDCGVDVYVDEGKITKIRGTKGHPYNHGNICAKGLAAGEVITNPNRVLYPMKRAGKRGEDKWTRISWDDALDEIAEKLKDLRDKYGSQCVSLTRGTGPGWEGSLMYHQLFMNAFGSGNYACQGYCCKFPRVVSTGITLGGEPDLDIENTKCILLWASNPADTSLPNYWSRISEARERGVKLIVIDSRFSRSASKADLHVRIKPGTDGALALGLANVIIKEGLHDKEFVTNYAHGFDEYADLAMEYPPERVEKITEIPRETIREVALAYGRTKPALLFVGNGVEQLTNTMQTMRAIYCLPALTGNIGVKGGHILNSPLPLPDLAQKSKFFGGLLESSVAQHKFFLSKLGGGASINIPDLYDAVRTEEPYPIKALFNIGSSFLTVIPGGNEAKELLREKLDLIVVHDLFMTAEARELADIVLPATSFLESWRFRFMRPGFKGNAYIQWVGLQRPVVAPVGESRSDEEFLTDLARRVGIGEHFPWKDVIEFTDDLVKPLGITAQELVDNPGGHLWEVPEEDVIRFYEKKGFNTPTKKFEFYSTLLEGAGFDPLPRYVDLKEAKGDMGVNDAEFPFLLNIGIKPGLFCHTQFHNVPLLHDLNPEPMVEIHPATADGLGIVGGETVRVETPNGNVSIKAEITEAIVRPEIVYMPYGWNEYGINNLSSHLPKDPISGTPSNHALQCRIVKVSA
jgi:formate dehydrogenase (coenzyme F420) alpha subunit